MSVEVSEALDALPDHEALARIAQAIQQSRAKHRPALMVTGSLLCFGLILEIVWLFQHRAVWFFLTALGVVTCSLILMRLNRVSTDALAQTAGEMAGQAQSIECVPILLTFAAEWVSTAYNLQFQAAGKPCLDAALRILQAHPEATPTLSPEAHALLAGLLDKTRVDLPKLSPQEKERLAALLSAG